MRLAGIAIGVAATLAALVPAAHAEPSGTLTFDKVSFEGYSPHVELTAVVTDACRDGRGCKWFALIQVMPESKQCASATETRWKGPNETRDDQNGPYRARYLTSTGPARERACLVLGTEDEDAGRKYELLAQVVYDVPASPDGTPAGTPPGSGTAPATAQQPAPTVALTHATAIGALRKAVRKRYRTTRGRSLRCKRATSSAFNCRVAWFNGTRTRSVRVVVRHAAGATKVSWR